MKTLLKVIALALVVGMAMVACKKKDEPAANYLVGKTFDYGTTPEQDPSTYRFSRFIFTSATQGSFVYEFKEGDDFRRGTTDFTYTYQDNKLVLTRSKIKYTYTRKTDNGLTTTESLEDDEDYNEGKVITFIVDENAGTLTAVDDKDDNEKPIVVKLKK